MQSTRRTRVTPSSFAAVARPTRRLRPIAACVAASLAAVGLLALAAAPAVQAKPVAPVAASASVQKIRLSTGLADGKMVFLDAAGKANPTLRAKVGDTLEITLASGEGAQHDIAIAELGVQSKAVDAASGPVTVRIKLTKPGKFTYFCTIPGHRQIGMEGTLEVTGSASADAATPAARPVQTVALRTAAAPAAPAPAATQAVSVAMDPNAVPAPIGARAPQHLRYRIETVELAGKLDDGTTFTYWTFDRKVPGPMLRARVGDTVTLTLANARDSKNVHSIDLHAVTGGHGGGADTQVAPGQEKTITFKALNAGLFVYHCATASVPHHISAGMYGLILVEPEGGLPKVEREFYVMQGDLYTSHPKGTPGHQAYDHAKEAAEQPEYYLFNGQVGSLTKEHKMTAKVGDTVRVYFGVGGPNKISSFHVIGEIFDKVYSEGSISTVKRDVQTTLVAPGGATIVEFKVEYPGSYLLVDHALSRLGKGAAGKLEVTGTPDATIYNAGGAPSAATRH
jgi:nitrite reductase (NO-forming)